MPSDRCAVQGCSNRSDITRGISIHNSPANKTVRAKWLRFITTHRLNYNPPARFAVCSKHFENSCFTRQIHVDGSLRRLIPGSVPTIWKTSGEVRISDRERRKSVKDILAESSREGDAISNEETSLVVEDAGEIFEESLPTSESATACEEQPENITEPYTENEALDTQDKSVGSFPENEALDTQLDGQVDQPVSEEVSVFSEPSESRVKTIDECKTCPELQRTVKKLKKENNNLRTRVRRGKNRLETSRQQLLKYLYVPKNTVGTQTVDEITCTVKEQPGDGVDLQTDDTDDESYEEMGINCDSKDFEDPVWTDSEPEFVSETMEDDYFETYIPNPGLEVKGKNLREEPKAIVFLSKLLQLFHICHLCLAPSPSLSIKQTGTMVSIEAKCQKCAKIFSWDSQPFMLGKFAAGNLLLSFGILCAGASVKKMLLVFKHINLLVYKEPLYYYHQKHLLIPMIWKFWQAYQSQIVDTLSGKEVILAGDARHDSVGHSAKYGTYTIFCCDVGLIIYISLVQANEAGSSTAMEFLGHKRSFEYLLGTNMVIKSFISDRHTSICKWMREELPLKCKALGKSVINHFFDLWHIGKKINKSLTKLSKESGCELVGRWTKACIRHFYWSVTSTDEKLGEVKLAKFHAFLYHTLNQHTDLPNKLFDKCSHGPVQTQKVYFTKGSEAYGKLCDVLNKKNIVAAVKKASPVGQTSCLEGYHSVVNQFAPKMLSFSYQGMLARTVLAALHFNHNLRRETKVDDNGQTKYRVTYPKYKYGEATVREAKVPPNFEYVDELFECLTTTHRNEFKAIREELKNSTPEPRYHMMECEGKDAAIAKYQSRQQKQTVIVPPTCTDAELQSLTNPQNSKTRKAPTCKTCGAPRKGHKRGVCATTQ